MDIINSSVLMIDNLININCVLKFSKIGFLTSVLSNKLKKLIVMDYTTQNVSMITTINLISFSIIEINYYYW